MWICPVCRTENEIGFLCSNCGAQRLWTFSSCLNHVNPPGTPVLVNNDWRSVIVSHCVIKNSLHYILWREPIKVLLTAGERYVVVSACRIAAI